jgi:hypothetical protein
MRAAWTTTVNAVIRNACDERMSARRKRNITEVLYER